MYFLKLLRVRQGRAGVVGTRSEEQDGGVRSDAEEEGATHFTQPLAEPVWGHCSSGQSGSMAQGM